MRNWYWKPLLGAGLLLAGLLGLTTYSIPARSMVPTLEVGD
jgi:signal peptidase I